jgi:Cell wall-active antibiotics response 4TMS YvqF/Domain of unknown function (DUF1707)
VPPRPGPHALRASDADRERVVTLLSEAAADGRLTLGELAVLTTDLAAPDQQPIRLDGRRLVTGIFGREQRDGRWVVPDRLAVSLVFGEVVLDLREAVLQSNRVQIIATALGGTLRLIVPQDVAVQVTGTTLLGRRASSGGSPASGPDTGRPGLPVIEVRMLGVGGRVKVTRPRRPRRLLRRR